MSETTAEVKITGDGSGAIAAVKQTETAVKNSFAQMKGAMEAVNAQFSKVQKSFMALAAVAAGGAAFKGAIDASVNWSLETGKLAKAMGASTEQASIMNVALTRLGLSGDLYQQASVALSRQLNSNAKAFDILRINTEGADKHLRSVGDLMPEINAKLAAIKNPLEQNIAGMQVYGRAWQELKPLLRLNAEAMAEAEKRARELGLIVGPEGEARAKLYKAQMRDLDLVGKSLSIQFGTQLLPIFTAIGGVMAKEGPQAARIFGDALKEVASAGITVWYTLQGIGTLIGGVGAAAQAVLTGNFGQAKEIMRMVIADVDNLEAKRKAAIADIWNPPTSTPKDDDTSPTYDFSKGNSVMPAFEDALAKYKLVFAQINDGRELDKEQEVAYWEAVLQATDLAAEDRIKIETKVANERVAILKNARKQREDIEAIEAKSDTDLALGKIEAAKVASDALLQAESISAAQRAAMEVEFEDQRYAIEKAALAKKIELLNQDPTVNAVKLAEAHAQMLVKEQQYQTKRMQLQSAATKAARQQREDIEAIETKNNTDLALGKIEAAKVASDALLQAESISAAQRAAMEVEFEDQRYAIEKAALAKKIELLNQDPTVNAVKLAEAHAQMLVEEQQYQTKRMQLQTAATKAAKADNLSLQTSLQTSFAQIFQTFAQGAMSIKSLFQQIGRAILNSFIGVFAQIAAKWLAQQVMMAVGEKVTALAAITAESAKAGAGGTASMAAAPFPLNLTAPAFGAAMAASALAYAPLASAAGGFDIPAGINPITQLHEREMVLPAPIADPMREMLANWGGGGGEVHIHATQSDFIRASDLGAMLQKMNRQFRFVGA